MMIVPHFRNPVQHKGKAHFAKCPDGGWCCFLPGGPIYWGFTPSDVWEAIINDAIRRANYEAQLFEKHGGIAYVG